MKYRYYSDKVLHTDTVYQSFIQQIIFVRAVSWPRYIDLLINTNPLLRHARMEEGFSGVRMSPVVRWVFAFTPHERIHTHVIMPTAFCVHLPWHCSTTTRQA